MMSEPQIVEKLKESGITNPGALLDRLTHRVHILEANGQSYRLRESKRRLQSRNKRSD